MDSLGTKVKKLRESLGLTQADLSRAARITQATISRLEANKLSQLKSDRLKSLSDALKVSADFLISEDESQKAEDVVSRDSQARDLVNIYSEMESEKRQQLRDFANFLANK